MLGAPCSPCCGCSANALLDLWEALKSRACSVTVSGTIPLQQAATTTALPYACTDSEENSRQILQGVWPTSGVPLLNYQIPRNVNAQAKFFKASESPAGQHSLPLVPSQTTFNPTTTSGQVVFRKTTEDYQITVTFAVSTANAASAVTVAGSPCFVVPSFSVVLYGPECVRLSGIYDLVNGTSTRTVQARQVDTGSGLANAPGEYNASIVHVAPQYWAVESEAFSDRYGGSDWYAQIYGSGSLFRFGGWWNFSMKPAELAWGSVSNGAVSAPMSSVGSGGLEFSGSASGNLNVRRWRPHFVPPFTNVGRWLTNVDPGKLNAISYGADGRRSIIYAYLNNTGISWTPPGAIMASPVEYRSSVEAASISVQATLT